MLDGAVQVLFEGLPTHPGPGRLWEIVDKYRVTQFYTAPTAIRSLMRAGDGPVKAAERTSLRVLGTVGEPINPAAWEWYYNVVGDSRCPIVDTYWQTETGSHLITPMAGAVPLKPGSATLPFFGVLPVVIDDKGNELEGECAGKLMIKKSFPSIMRTVFGDHERFEKTYFSECKGYYFTGDGCKRDKDGFFFLTGRMDDVINVSGHRIGTAEVESALVQHAKVAEAAVVGFPHDIKGEGIYCFVTLMEGEEYVDDLKKELVVQVRAAIGAFAAPDAIHWAPGLPKTRSGKIMRRILRKLALPTFATEDLGDISTLADPSVVEVLKSMKPK
jgi:acetyl-CoA synthetase